MIERPLPLFASLVPIESGIAKDAISPTKSRDLFFMGLRKSELSEPLTQKCLCRHKDACAAADRLRFGCHLLLHENPCKQGTSLNQLAKFRAWHGVRDVFASKYKPVNIRSVLPRKTGFR